MLPRNGSNLPVLLPMCTEISTCQLVSCQLWLLRDRLSLPAVILVYFEIIMGEFHFTYFVFCVYTIRNQAAWMCVCIWHAYSLDKFWIFHCMHIKCIGRCTWIDSFLMSVCILLVYVSMRTEYWSCLFVSKWSVTALFVVVDNFAIFPHLKAKTVNTTISSKTKFIE